MRQVAVDAHGKDNRAETPSWVRVAVCGAEVTSTLRPDETPPPDVIRVRLPVEPPADPKRPALGRLGSAACPTALVMIEA
jgi:hypothetical protein